VSYMTNALIDAHILQWRTDIDWMSSVKWHRS
jgi:hypothetical protein